jgi:hypothetical protein
VTTAVDKALHAGLDVFTEVILCMIPCSLLYVTGRFEGPMRGRGNDAMYRKLGFFEVVHIDELSSTDLILKADTRVEIIYNCLFYADRLPWSYLDVPHECHWGKI